MNKYLVLAGFQGVWFVSVLAAAGELFWLGPFSAICWLLIYAWKSGAIMREMLLSFTAGLIGLCVDTFLIRIGVFLPKGISSLQVSPAWMIGLWLNFGTAINSLLYWLKKRYALSALLGFIGGSAAYYSGASLGAASISQPFMGSLALIGIVWGIAMPLLVWLSEKIR